MNRRLWIGAALLATVLVSGCASVGASPPPTAEAPTPTAQATPALPATQTARATPAITDAAGSPSPTPSAQPTETLLEPAPPPVAELKLPSGNSVPGQQGSWCYDGACADVPAFPKDELPAVELAQTDGSLTFVLADTHPFSYWSASYAAGPDAAWTELDTGGQYHDPDLSDATPGPLFSTFEFDAPPTGDWVLTVSLQFGDRGDAVYSWRAVVP